MIFCNLQYRELCGDDFDSFSDWTDAVNQNQQYCESFSFIKWVEFFYYLLLGNFSVSKLPSFHPYFKLSVLSDRLKSKPKSKKVFIGYTSKGKKLVWLYWLLYPFMRKTTYRVIRFNDEILPIALGSFMCKSLKGTSPNEFILTDKDTPIELKVFANELLNKRYRVETHSFIEIKKPLLRGLLLTTASQTFIRVINRAGGLLTFL